MGSEGPAAVTVHVTGFKKFHGVSENPTETIVNNLIEYMKKKSLPKGWILGSCTVLETAGHGALVPLYQTLQSAIVTNNSESQASGRVIWVHFGVNSGATKFAIEHRAVNEATFRCPDEMGWKPQKVPIIPSDGGMSRVRERTATVAGCCFFYRMNIGLSLRKKTLGMISVLMKHSSCSILAPASLHCEGLLFFNCKQTTLPVEEITKALVEKGYDVMTSDDAGRFVCNYVYYHSLWFAEKNGINALFVHVPLFLTINEDTQMQFAASLLEVLASLCQ